MKIIQSLLILSLLAACGKTKAPNEEKTLGVVSVEMAKVTKEILSRPITASGLISSSDEARLSFKVGGIIQQIFVKEGQNVATGQLLATLNQTEIAAQVNQAKEGVQKSERDVKRIGNLYRDSVATYEQFQNVSTALAMAKENLQIAQFNQQYSQIKAPMAGKILKKIMNEGEITGPGSPVFFLIGNGPKNWIIKVGLTDKDWARTKLGDRAEVHLDAYPNQTFTAAVSKLSDLSDPTTGTFATELTLNTSGQKIATGLMASVNIIKNDAVATTVIPVEAIVEANGHKGFVYINENGKAKRIAVTIAYLLGDKTVISSGLEGISEVVSAGAMYLSDGASIQINQK